MSIAASPKRTTSTPKTKTGSLLRSTVIWLLLLTLVPVFVTGVVTYLRTRSLLKDQFSAQMQVLVDSHMRDLSDFADVRAKGIAKLTQGEQFEINLTKIVNSDLTELDKASAKVAMLHVFTDFLSASPDTIFDELSIIDSKGTVLISNNAVRNRKSYADAPVLMNLLGVDKVSLLYNAAPVFPGEYTWTASHVYIHPDSGEKFTILGAIESPFTAEMLDQITKQFPGAVAYLTFSDNRAITLDETGASVDAKLNDAQRLMLTNLAAGAGEITEYTGSGDVAMLSHGQFLDTPRLGLILEVPQSVVYEQLGSILTFNLTFLLIVTALITIIVTVGVRRVVSPLVKLADIVRGFSGGQFTERATIKRDDEIGVLANAFNAMADQLTRLYQSLESKVDERNRQLQTAAEIAQMVSASSSREDILKQTVGLILEQFQCDNASIYLLDPSHTHFTHADTGGRLNPEETKALLNQRIRTFSVFGQVISTNEMRTLTYSELDGEDRPETLLPGQSAEVVIPIAAGNQVLGLLDAQSPSVNFFSSDLVAVLKMLADQVANGVQNINLIESTQVDLQETSLVYRASRQISQAHTKNEIYQALIGVIEKTPYVGLLLEERDNELVVIAIASAEKPVLPPQKVSVSLTRTQQFLQQRPYAIVGNIGHPSDFYTAFSLLFQRDCKSAAIVPIQSGENLSQMFIIGARSESALTEASIQPYISLAEVIANTQERLSAQIELEQNVKDLRTLATVSQAVSGENQLEKIFPLLREQITEAFGGNIDFLMALFNEKTGMVEIPYMIEQGEMLHIDPFPLGSGLTSYVIKNRKPLLLSTDVEKQSAALAARIVGLPAKSWAGVPLMVGNEVVGALVVEDTQRDGRFDERDISLLSTLAPQVAIAVRNAQLVTEMQQALRAYDQERYLLNTLLDNIPDKVYFKDRAGKYIRASASLATQHGLASPDALVGKAEPELDESPEALEKQAEEEFIMAERNPQSGSVEKQIDERGTETWALVSRLPMIDSAGSVAGLLGIHRDITGLKQAEELAQKRARQVRTAAEIARDTSGTLNLNELLEKSVNLVRDRFGYYHASIFLLDPLREYAVLRESTGEAGMQLKSAGHKLAVGSQSIVGQAVYSGEALVVNDVTREANYYPNPLLPMTHSELAIPLKAGDTITGAIDVQSTQVDAFGVEDINILRILADQLAGAIVNADLYAQTQANVAKHRFLHQITTAASACTNMEDALSTTVHGLTTALGTDRVAVYLYNPQGELEIRASAGYSEQDIAKLKVAGRDGAIGLAALGRRTILVKDTLTDTRYLQADERVRSQLAVPILYSDVAMGVLCMESTQVAAYDENDQDILGSLGNNLGAILSNAQLVSQVSQQVEQQKMLFEITNKIRRATDIDTILQTSTREICRIVQARRAHIEITAGSNGNGHNGYKEVQS